MSFCKILLCHTVTSLLMVVVCVSTISAADECWAHDSECVVRVTLHQNHSERVDVPMEIDCTYNANSPAPGMPIQQESHWLHRFDISQNVTLDGCHTPVGALSYGFEVLPNCGKITQITVQRFHSDILQQLHCTSGNDVAIEVLIFRNNEIGILTAEALRNLRQVREIFLIRNFLRHIEHNAFHLPLVEIVHIETEPLLSIKEADLLERADSLHDVRLIALKRITAEFFVHLPQSLRQLYVANTPINGYLSMITSYELRNISIVGCDLSTVELHDNSTSVLHVNLSGNAIIGFTMDAENGCALETLDLSGNKLFSLSQVIGLSSCKLSRLDLSGNLFKMLSLTQLLESVPVANFIDLRGNQLMALDDPAIDLIDCERIRISMDDNPWNCMWLLDFAHTHPEKFRLFQYEKFISKINVNGLECNPEEMSHLPTSTATDSTGNAATRNTSKPMNISTYTLVYGSPWEIKRNQRAEALIIVFMLPLGIALLFLLLYMWIYCQKMFHWSYYRSFNPLARTGASSVDRFDVVRRFPGAGNNAVCETNCNGGYEMPLNCVGSCNCNNVTTPTSDGIGCKKKHHITYEPLPTEQSFSIYEEVIDGNVADDSHALYDRLSTVGGDSPN